MVLLISDKLHKIRNKDGCYIMMKPSSDQEDIIILNVYTSNNTVSKLTNTDRTAKKKKGKFAMKAEVFNKLLLVINSFSRQKISKGIVELNNIINHLNQIDFYRTFH